MKGLSAHAKTASVRFLSEMRLMFTPSDRHRMIRIELLLNDLLNQGEEIMTKEAELLTAIQEETDAGMAVVLLLDKIAGDLADLKAGMDPDAAAKLDEAISKIKSNKEAWAAAVVRDTPADGGAVDPHAAAM